MVQDLISLATTRQGRIQLIETVVTHFLDEPKWGEEYEPDSEEVEKSASLLAEQYYEYTNASTLSTTVIFGTLLCIDLALVLNAQVYGLILNVWATTFFVRPSLKGPIVIATAVEEKSQEAVRKLECQEMVFTNIGFAVFALGFILQVLAVQFLPSREVFQNNVLRSVLPGWTTGILLLLSIVAGLWVFNHVHKHYSS